MIEQDPDRPETIRCFVDRDFEPTTPDKAVIMIRIGLDGFRETLIADDELEDESDDE